MIDVEATIQGLDVLGAALDDATKQIVADIAHEIQAAAMAKAPVGTPGNTTNAPGDLRRSIDVEGPAGGDGVYAARVGPTVIYGRQRELGGEIFAKRDAGMYFVRFGVVYHNVFRVYQHPEPYMLPALEESWPAFEAIAIGRIAAVIEAT